MTDAKFNLLDEKWIRVIDDKCVADTVSLKTLFKEAHNYTDLCGELPTQDVAVLRVLLAVLHTVFSRYDLDGNEKPFESSDDALERWKELWDRKSFPEKVIDDYLEKWRDRFFLFHPERPFWQVKEAEKGTSYEASKLNGLILKSTHKERLFQAITGKAKEEISYSEAARWLIYTNAFDDTSVKKAKNASKEDRDSMASASLGWLAQLGLLSAMGNNLFETLMLNLVMVNPNNMGCRDEEKPNWELSKKSVEERVKVSIPNNLSELYTIQSRRLLLIEKNGLVVGFCNLAGDYFNVENAFVEPMTVWEKNKKKEPGGYVPCTHSESVQFWREFPSVYSESDENHIRPGLLSWIAKIKNSNLLPNNFMLNIRIYSVQYETRHMSVINTFVDSLTINGQLMVDIAKPRRLMVIRSVEVNKKIADIIWALADKINKAAGGEKNACASEAKAQYYYRIDNEFRLWLATLSDETDIDNSEIDWLKQAVYIADRLADELVAKSGVNAFIGHLHKRKYYSSAEAKNFYDAAMSKYRKTIKAFTEDTEVKNDE